VIHPAEAIGNTPQTIGFDWKLFNHRFPPVENYDFYRHFPVAHIIYREQNGFSIKCEVKLSPHDRRLLIPYYQDDSCILYTGFTSQRLKFTSQRSAVSGQRSAVSGQDSDYTRRQIFLPIS
jgi:hypothetical protein